MMSARIHPRLEQVSGRIRENAFVELYLIRGQENIVIDTGTEGAVHRELVPALSALGLMLSDIGLVINTHGHPDHTGGNRAIKDAGGAQVWIHAVDAPFLNDRNAIFDRCFAPLCSAMERDTEVEKQSLFVLAGLETDPDHLIEDGDVIESEPGITLRMIHLPGHSTGSVGIYWEEEEILFSGDAVSGLHVEGGNLPIIYDLPRYLESLERLREIPIRVLLCGHRYRALGLPTSSIRQGLEVREFLDKSVDIAERLEEAIARVKPFQNSKSFMEFSRDIIASLPRAMKFAPLGANSPLWSAQTILSRLNQY